MLEGDTITRRKNQSEETKDQLWVGRGSFDNRVARLETAWRIIKFLAGPFIGAIAYAVFGG